jgi:RNA polymerase sigma-70 factor, ECF subfamily
VPPEVNHLRLIAGEGARAEPLVHEPSLDDTQLLAALRAGDASAATALHDRTRSVVERTVRRLLGTRDADSEDLCQQSFIALIDTMQHFRGDCPLDSWVSMVTARVVYKQLRRRTIERRFFASTPLQLVPDVISAPKQSSVLRDLVGRVAKHLHRVDEIRAWTFLLHDAYGYDLKEIAQITGVSVAAAQTRLVRGRREVHERISADPGLAGALDDWREPGDP